MNGSKSVRARIVDALGRAFLQPARARDDGGWNGAVTALNPTQWIDLAEGKHSTYQVLTGTDHLFRHPVPFEVALHAFTQYARRTGVPLRLVDQAESVRISGGAL